MIAACPKCNARYRVDEAKVGPQGARLRCAKCNAVFRVRAPGAPAEPPAAAPVDTTAAAPRPAAQPPADPGATSRGEAHYDRERLVLVADPQEDAGKGTASALASWGLQTILVHDGVEAMLTIQRALPRVVILDAALPKMYGFQVCEVIKRNDSLRDTKVILVGAIHNRDRYRRPPSELYGADLYLEQPDLPDALYDVMVRFGLPVGGGAQAVAPAAQPAAAPPPAPTPVPRPAPTPAPVAEASPPPAAPAPPAAATPAPSAPAPAPAAPAPAAAADDGLAAEREKAERLARIVVSDIVLYQGEKFEAAIRAGNLLEALDSEIEEGRSFFRQRIDEAVREERDYLIEELMRVARERGMQ